MNKDQVKGRIEEAKGAVKEVAGKAVGNKELEIKGKIQNLCRKSSGFIWQFQEKSQRRQPV